MLLSIASRIASSARLALAASASSALPTAKATPSTSAAVIVIVAWMPFRLTGRDSVAGLAGSNTENGALLPRTSRQS